VGERDAGDTLNAMVRIMCYCIYILASGGNVANSADGGKM